MIFIKKPIFTGCATALATPFDGLGEVDYSALARLIDIQAEGGADAIVLCATTGECVTLSDREFEQIVDFGVKYTAGRMPVLAGTGRNSTEKSLYLSRIAENCGVDGLLMVNPYYNKSTQKGLVEHYTYIADRINTPIILYNVPSRTGMSIAPATYATLSEHPMIYGTKEASGDISLIAHAIALCDDDFVFYSGNDDQVAAICALGGKGVISTSANIAPQKMSALCKACNEGDFSRAAELQLELLPLIDALFAETNPIPLKAALELAGICSGKVRLPLTTPSSATIQKLKNVLLQLNILQ